MREIAGKSVVEPQATTARFRKAAIRRSKRSLRCWARSVCNWRCRSAPP